MDKFILSMHISIDFCFEIISLLAALFFYIKKGNKIILYFIPFLLVTVVVESIGAFYLAHGKRNYLIYNIFTSIEFLFYSFLFLHFLKKALFNNSILIFLPSYLLLVILNMFFVQGLNETFNTYSFLVGSFFIVVFCCCYFYESVLPENADLHLIQEPFFWICSGLLIFYLGSVIINTLFEYLRSKDLQNEGILIYGFINNSLNVILYSTFCIAFYLSPSTKEKKEQKN